MVFLAACRTGLYQNSNSLILLDLFTGGKIRNFKEINGLSLKSDRPLAKRTNGAAASGEIRREIIQQVVFKRIRSAVQHERARLTMIA
jgi:hypothetical protein